MIQKERVSSSCSSSSSTKRATMFDHERLDVYQVSLDLVTFVFALVAPMTGVHRHARDQIIRASQSIPLNIAEGNGKRAGRDRNRYFEIARGSAMECAAVLDVLVRTNACRQEAVDEGKRLLVRVVSMLYKMTMIRTQIREQRLDDDDE